MLHTGDEPGLNGVGAERKYDRNGSCRRLRSMDRRWVCGHNDVDLMRNEFACEFRQPFELAIGEAPNEFNVLALGVAQFLELALQCVPQIPRICLFEGIKDANPGNALRHLSPSDAKLRLPRSFRRECGAYNAHGVLARTLWYCP